MRVLRLQLVTVERNHDSNRSTPHSRLLGIALSTMTSLTFIISCALSIQDIARHYREVETQQAVYRSLLHVLGPLQANLAAVLLKGDSAMILEVRMQTAEKGSGCLPPRLTVELWRFQPCFEWEGEHTAYLQLYSFSSL